MQDCEACVAEALVVASGCWSVSTAPRGVTQCVGERASARVVRCAQRAW